MNDRVYTIIITVEGKEVHKFAFNKGNGAKVIIGKNEDSVDVVINQNFVSRKHLELYKDENETLFITDLNSTNGVFVNNLKIEPGKRTIVKKNDIISLTKSSAVQLLVLGKNYTSLEKGAVTSFNGKGESFIDLLNKKQKISLGRSKDCDIILDSNFASQTHAYLEKDNVGNYYITDNASTNGTYVDGKLISGCIKITEDLKIMIGKIVFTLRDNTSSIAPVSIIAKNNKRLIDLLSQNKSVSVGRSDEVDITIKDNIISRKHAKFIRENNKTFVEDLNSTNGVFINGKKTSKKTEIFPDDEIRIGLSLFKLNNKLNENELEQNIFTSIRAENITKKFENGYVGVHPMSFSIPTKSFIALMGPSGCGKTTLMNMLNGANPATSGKIFIHGLELLKNYDLLKQKIGYVPQDDIVHKELTVNKSLYYAAKLRMNEDTTNKEIWQRIDEVCTNLNINDKEIRENKIKKLSGGQRKRVSIAVELLNNPSILFLDEPTSPLDPETIDGFLKSIKELTALENTTVIMVTHKPSDLHYADRVIFIAKKGYPAYYGEENRLYSYFGVENSDIINIYSVLSENANLTAWYGKWNETHKTVKTKEDPSSIKQNRKTSLTRQLFWLTQRYANIKKNDFGNMAILIAQPIIIPLALIYIYSELQLGILFMMSVSAIWFGVSNAAKEIVKELPVYTRERMFNLSIVNYILSKLAVLSIIAIIQVTVFVLVLKMKFSGGDIELVNIGRMIAFMFYLTFSATLLGLALSALFKNSEQVMSIIPIVLIPQIIFAGVIATIDTKDKEVISYAMLGRWGTEGLARIQNDHPGYSSINYSDIVNQTTGNNTENSNSAKPVYGSVYKKIPASNNKGYVLVKSDPLKTLGYNNNRKLLNSFNSFEKNLFAITLLNIFTFYMLFIFLRRKDKIKITI